MKILFAHDHRFIQVGSEVYSESQFPTSLWRRYLRNFQSMIVFARRGKMPINKKIEDLQVSSCDNVEFRFGSDLSSIYSQLFHRGHTKKLLKYCLSDVDAVVARLPSELGLLAISEAKLLNIPCLIELVACPWNALCYHGGIKAKLYAPVMTFRVHKAVYNAQYVHYVTNKYLQKNYPNTKGYTLSCSDVELSVISDDIIKKRIDKINNSNKLFTIGLIGSLNNRYKGIDTVLSALAMIKNDYKDVIFRVLGGGDTVSWVKLAKKYEVESMVIFDGTLPSGRPVFDWIDNIDLYLQPSLQEGLPRALIEAMSRGCPAIGSICGGIPELLDSDCLIKKGDYKRLAQLFCLVINNKKWLQDQAIRNWNHSKLYSSEVLEKSRNLFWDNFSMSIVS